MMSGGKTNRLFWVLPFILLGSLVYSNTVHVPFYFDDIQNIVENPAVRLVDTTFSNLIKAGTESPLSNRPVSYISFALNYFFHQYEVEGYHFVNIAIHILTSIFLFYLFQTTLSETAYKKNNKFSPWVPFFAALLWLVHPIQTQSVTYIVQRMNCMAAMFYIFSMVLYVQGRLTGKSSLRIASFTGSFVVWLFALGTKEIAATLPFVLLLYEWFFFQDMSWAWLKKQRFYLAGLCIIMLLLVLLFLGSDPFRSILSGYRYRDFDLPQRIMTEFRVIFIYLGLFLLPLPSRLSLEHDVIVSQSLLIPPSTVFSVLGVIVMVIVAVLSARKYRLFSFAVFWLLGNLIIESSFIPLELIFEHRMYLPSMFLCLLLSFLCFRYLKKRLAVGVMISIVLLSSAWAYERNAVWKEPVSFYKNIVDNVPGNWRAQYNYGVYMYKTEKYEEAIHHLKKAIQLEPRHLFAYVELGLAYTRTGEYDAAIIQFNTVKRLTPDWPAVYDNLGYLYSKKGENKKALMHYNKAVLLDPENVDTRLRIGYLYASLGDFQTAINHFQKVLSLSEEHRFEMLNNMGIYYAKMGEYDNAVLHFKDALYMKPNSKELLFNLELAQKKLQLSK